MASTELESKVQGECRQVVRNIDETNRKILSANSVEIKNIGRDDKIICVFWSPKPNYILLFCTKIKNKIGGCDLTPWGGGNLNLFGYKFSGKKYCFDKRFAFEGQLSFVWERFNEKKIIVVAKDGSIMFDRGVNYFDIDNNGDKEIVAPRVKVVVASIQGVRHEVFARVQGKCC